MRRLSLLMIGFLALAGVAVAPSGGATEAQSSWVITDLGTLGGRASWAVAINGQGRIAGSSLTKQGGQHAFVWIKGRMIDLGTLGGPQSAAVAINERGQVVGWADTKAKFPSGDWWIQHAFLWEHGKMRDLGTLGGLESAAMDISTRGQVVGWANTGKVAGGIRISHAFVWQNGEMRDLGTARRRMDAVGFPMGINEHSQVVFTAVANDVGHALFWDHGRVLDLGSLGGQESWATGINERSQIVGSASTRRSSSIPFLFANGKMRALGTRGEPVAINGQGKVIVNGPRAFLWANGKVTPIGGRGDSVGLAGINERGLVVGSTQSDRTCDLPGMGDPIPFAFAWANGKEKVLPTLRGRRVASSPGGPPSGIGDADYSGTGAVNSKGQIVGWSESGLHQAGSDYCSSEGLHAVLWTLKR